MAWNAGESVLTGSFVQLETIRLSYVDELALAANDRGSFAFAHVPGDYAQRREWPIVQSALEARRYH